MEKSTRENAKREVLLALEQFNHALLECRKTVNQMANGAPVSTGEAEQIELCLTLMGSGVEELRQTVQTKL